MSVKGSTALVRMASNPECEILGAMVLQPGSEKRFYERVVGKPYDREFGERQSSKRRGAQFEQNAYAGDARLLREALAEALQTHAEHLTVRNLLDDYPGAKDDARIGRLRITRGILMDAYAGRAAPDIIVQPQLLLPTKPGPKPFFFIGPDLLIRSRENGMYLPGDLKSFIVRENEIAPSDLARVRLQLGAQVLALRHEYDRIDRSVAVPGKGVLVFSRPNGLRPHAPRIEDVEGAVEAVRIGVAAFLRHRHHIDALRAGAEPYTVVADLKPNFQDACLSTCVMAQWCRQHVAGTAADLGDVAGQALGDTTIEHLFDLMTGAAAPADDREAEVAARLRLLADRHGLGRAA
ncbi:hypothetical protein [Mesorhizobium caraganae]|uniref:hypothetical protein n=1 Tax=Mesorhizobium caraganae TaxID=483206 RepID=UPI003ED0962B